MKKKVLELFLILAACMALFCITASATVNVKVGGGEAKTENPAVKSGTVTWYGNTLTLEDACIEATGTGIDIDLSTNADTMAIELKGTNTLTVYGDPNGYAFGIFAYANQVQGSGAPTVQFKGGLSPNKAPGEGNVSEGLPWGFSGRCASPD